jgi:tellurite resistance protein TehA-like permease
LSVRGPFFGFLIALIVIMAVLATIYLADIACRALESVNKQIASAMGVNATTEYSESSDKLVASLAVIIAAAIVFLIALVTVHLKRR